MNFIAKNLLEKISDLKNLIDIEGSAYNIREDGQCAGRKSTKNIKIESKEDAPGLVVRIRPGTKNEKVYIPACVTHGSVDDLVYNDFYIGEDADVTIVAGCGVHTEDDGRPATMEFTGLFWTRTQRFCIWKNISEPEPARESSGSIPLRTQRLPKERF